MNFRDWKNWVKTLSWERRWFVILVFIRPIIDVFYGLKKISPVLSPLILVGGMTPVLVFMSIQSRRMEGYHRVFQDKCIIVLAFILFSNALFLCLREFNFDVLHVGLKALIAPVVYVYLRHFIRTERDLIGIIATFLFSTIFPLGMFVYEKLVGQLGPGQLARGELRFEGLYSDVLSYSTYINFSFLCSTFFFLLSEHKFGHRRKATFWFVATFVVCLAAMLSIKHAASWGVFSSLLILVMAYSLNPRSLVAAVVVLLIVCSSLFFAREQIQYNLGKVFGTEVAVYAGDVDKERALHGRVWIWSRYYERWERSGVLAKMFGSGWWSDRRQFEGRSDAEAAVIMMSGGMHSDYVRLFYGTGIVGLLCFLFFMTSVVHSSFMADRTLRFVMLGCSGSMLLYSISTTPLLYASANYFPTAIFAYAALLKERRRFMTYQPGTPPHLQAGSWRG